MIVSKLSIRPTDHYHKYHSDVSWILVIKAILSPTKTKVDKRYGKNRFTYIRKSKKYMIKIHVEKDDAEDIIWVINAFKISRR